MCTVLLLVHSSTAARPFLLDDQFKNSSLRACSASSDLFLQVLLMILDPIALKPGGKCSNLEFGSGIDISNATSELTSQTLLRSLLLPPASSASFFEKISP